MKCRERGAAFPAAALLLAIVTATALPPAAAVTCESYRILTECSGKVTDSGYCRWANGGCHAVEPLPEGVFAIASVRDDRPVATKDPAQPAAAVSAPAPAPAPEYEGGLQDLRLLRLCAGPAARVRATHSYPVPARLPVQPPTLPHPHLLPPPPTSLKHRLPQSPRAADHRGARILRCSCTHRIGPSWRRPARPSGQGCPLHRHPHPRGLHLRSAGRLGQVRRAMDGGGRLLPRHMRPLQGAARGGCRRARCRAGRWALVQLAAAVPVGLQWQLAIQTRLHSSL